MKVLHSKVNIIGNKIVIHKTHSNCEFISDLHKYAHPMPFMAFLTF